jgi:hypothetical protein
MAITSTGRISSERAQRAQTLFDRAKHEYGGRIRYVNWNSRTHIGLLTRARTLVDEALVLAEELRAVCKYELGRGTKQFNIAAAAKKLLNEV